MIDLPGIIVQLGDEECRIAEAIGQWRVDEAELHHRGPGHGEVSRPYTMRLEHAVRGALGELALCKFLGIYWHPGRDRFGRHGDVEDYEVRATMHPRGCCIVFPEDPGEREVVLVVVERFDDGAHCRVVGKIAIAAARTDENEARARDRVRLGSPRQWWVPQEALTPL